MYFMSYLQSVSIAFRFYRYINFSTSAKHKKNIFLKNIPTFFFFFLGQISKKVFLWAIWKKNRWMETHSQMTRLTRKGSDTLLFSLVFTHFLSSFTCKDGQKMSTYSDTMWLYHILYTVCMFILMLRCVCAFLCCEPLCRSSTCRLQPSVVVEVGQVHCSCTWRERRVMEAVV